MSRYMCDAKDHGNHENSQIPVGNQLPQTIHQVSTEKNFLTEYDFQNKQKHHNELNGCCLTVSGKETDDFDGVASSHHGPVKHNGKNQVS